MEPFRRGNTLATTFTGTLSERAGTPVERVTTTDRLLEWFALNGLAVETCSPAQHARALTLREAIHEVLAASADGSAPRSADVDVLNDGSADGRASAALTADGRVWRLASGSVEDALSVIAADAIALAAGERDGRLARCASDTCRAVFLDTSQSRTRRWCDMNTCGNRHKKERWKARHTPPTR